MNYDKILDTFSLEEIYYYNDLTEEDVLKFLVEQEFVILPTPEPVDL